MEALLTSFLQHYNKDHIHYLHWVVEICGSHSARLLLLEGFFFSCVGMKARPTAKMPWAYLFCKNDYNAIGFLYTIKQTTKIKCYQTKTYKCVRLRTKKRYLQSKTHYTVPPALNPYGKRHCKSRMGTGGEREPYDA